MSQLYECLYVYALQVLDYGITDLKAFFSSAEFGRGNFELDEERSVIRHHLVR